MNLLEIQKTTHCNDLPGKKQLQLWVDRALVDIEKDTECVIRIVDEQESAQLNQQFRNKQGPTNVLSFPFKVPENIESNLLGDLVICAPLIKQEAMQQHKIILHHWAHMVVHGILHLRGYDHQDEKDAELMEVKEIEILASLKINNPYQEYEALNG